MMTESRTFCSRYLIGFETRFTRDERNDDSILDDEMIDEFEVFMHKVWPLRASSVQTLSKEEKDFFHWYILKNIDEKLEYRK